ncbi:MAG: MarR family winged helix-turn-helix transcriptional regulator [Pseudomonadota bacterium]
MTDESMEPSGFSLESSASHLLHRAQQVAASRSADALKAAGITLRQFSLLAAVAREEGVSQAKLVEVTGIDRSTLADMASRMEQSRLIKRAASATDARAKSVSLLAAGRRALEKAMPGVAEADAAIVEALPKTRRDAFLKSLSTLAASEASGAEAAAPSAPPPPPPPPPPAKKAPKPKATKPAKPKAAKASGKAETAAASKPKKKKASGKGKKKK